jgi:predicted type IV restriction endonuclease
MDIKRLNELSTLDLSNFIQSENNVKYKIVIPILQSFGHQQLDMEHAAQGSRIDINIGNKIIVETKALGQNLDIYVQQLSEYCGRERPVLAILTNGKNFRIYSPLWRHQRTFPETIIYSFDIKDCENVQLLNRLDEILGLSNYQSGAFLDYIEQREKELLKANRDIDELKKSKAGKGTALINELSELKEKLQKLTTQIKLKEQAIAENESQQLPEIQSLISDLFLPIFAANPIIQPIRIMQPRINSEVHKKGERLIINNPRNGVLAYGYLLANDEFTVLNGSTISKSTAPKFQTSARKAFELRTRSLSDGTINSQNQFTRDVTFNSISQAASVILGDSKNGNKEWTKE